MKRLKRGTRNLTEVFKSEEGISELYSEGLRKYPGWTSGFIHIITRTVENSGGDGRSMFDPADIAINHIIGGMASMGMLLSADQSDAQMDLAIQSNTRKLSQQGVFIEEMAGLLKALIELKGVCIQRTATAGANEK